MSELETLFSLAKLPEAEREKFLNELSPAQLAVLADSIYDFAERCASQTTHDISRVTARKPRRVAEFEETEAKRRGRKVGTLKKSV